MTEPRATLRLNQRPTFDPPDLVAFCSSITRTMALHPSVCSSFNTVTLVFSQGFCCTHHICMGTFGLRGSSGTSISPLRRRRRPPCCSDPSLPYETVTILSSQSQPRPLRVCCTQPTRVHPRPMQPIKTNPLANQISSVVFDIHLRTPLSVSNPRHALVHRAN
jgi:hypothetical protein